MVPTMPTPPVVLTVGLVPILLESRCEVLRSVGYTVIAAGSYEEATNHFVHGKVDLVLLCHTIPSVARQSLIQQFRDHASHTPIVSVGSLWGQNDDLVDATVDSDPVKLIADIQELLQKRSSTAGNASSN